MPRGKLFGFKNSLTRVSVTLTVQYSGASLQDVTLAEKKAGNAQHKPSYYEWRMAGYHNLPPKTPKNNPKENRKT